MEEQKYRQQAYCSWKNPSAPKLSGASAIVMAEFHNKCYSNDLFAAERFEIVGADVQHLAIDAIVVVA